MAEDRRKNVLRRGFRVVSEFQYGAELRKVRFEHKSKRQADKDRPEKTFTWEHRIGKNWYSGDGGLTKPLYVNQFFRERDQLEFAVGFEGEAKANLAEELRFAAFSFKNITIEQAATLAGCDIVLWPDNDESGAKQAQAAARVISQSGQARSVSITLPLPELPPAADIIDAVINLGWNRTRVEQLLRSANPYVADSAGTTRGLAGTAVAKSDDDARPARHFPFEVSDEGVFFLKDQPSDGTVERIRISARIDVVAKTRNEVGEEWGRLLAWRDDEGRLHRWAMPMEALASDFSGVRGRLLSDGPLFITTNLRYRERLGEYLQNAPATRRARAIGRVGWCGNSYVLPDQAISPDGGEEIIYQPRCEADHKWREKRDVDGWRENIGRICGGNSRLVLSVCCGFAGAILRIVGSESGGFHFRGGSSIGKTTALLVGGSVCGGGGQSGFIQPWRTTINGLEAVAEAHNDGTLFLDELSQVDPREAADTAYLLGNGQGKSRMTRGLGPRTKPSWNIIFVSSGEISLAEHSASAGKKTRAGVEVRLVNIEADAGRGLGMFEDLHGMPSPERFVERLRRGTAQQYGAVFRSFIHQVTQNRSDIKRTFEDVRKALQDVVPPGASGEVKRVADRFAVIGTAGELATGWGLTGWNPGEAIGAMKRCLAEWIQTRGTSGSSDVANAIRQVQAFVEAHGSSRFQLLHSAGGNSNNDRITNRAGFKRIDATGETEYMILKEVFRGEVCAGYNHQSVAKELERLGFLVREGKELTCKRRLPELGMPWVYCIRTVILESES